MFSRGEIVENLFSVNVIKRTHCNFNQTCKFSFNGNFNQKKCQNKGKSYLVVENIASKTFIHLCKMLISLKKVINNLQIFHSTQISHK